MTPSSDYKVTFLNPAKHDLRRLWAKARELGVDPVVEKAMRDAVSALKSDPAAFGNPLHKTRRPGGVVCHGNVPPILVRFAVYDDERVVLVYRVLPLPSSPLDN